MIDLENIKIIDVKQSIFKNNDQDAERLRKQLKQEKTFLINLMSSPGAGKTTTLLALLKKLISEMSIGILEADIDSAVDTEALQQSGYTAIQLHTGGMCHLDADMTRQGLKELNSTLFDLVILENVGNLVCPAEFDTGAIKNITILSVPEGHDKPLKYPLMYQVCDLLIVNKIDVLPYFDFDKNKVVEYARKRNSDIEIIFTSAKTGEGIGEIAEWVKRNMIEWNTLSKA